MNSKYQSRSADKFVVSLPDGLRSDIQAAADELDTSMNTVLIHAVRKYLDHQNRQGLLLDALAAAVEKNSTFIAVRNDQVRDLEQRRHAEQQACQAAERRTDTLAGLLRQVLDSSVLSFEMDAPENLEALEADICAAINQVKTASETCCGSCPGGYVSEVKP